MKIIKENLSRMKRLVIKLVSTSLFLLIPVSIVCAQVSKVIPHLMEAADKNKMTHWVDSIYNTMSLEEKVGQLFIIVASGDNTDSNRTSIISQINDQHVGGILFSKGTPLNQAKLTNAAQEVAKIPLMITLDGEWGLSMRLENTTKFPRNMMLGAIQEDSLIYYYGREVARQCRLLGIHVNFAPDMDVNVNPNNPVIGNRSFGENPKRVAKAGVLYSKGLEDGRVMAVSKHFPGHGDTSADSHYTLPVINHDRERLTNIEIFPFREYINAGLSGIMVAHLYIPVLDSVKQPSTLSKLIATDLLQEQLGFSGLIFTDGLQMKGVLNEDNHCVRAILAGNDMLLGPMSLVKEYNSVKKAVEEGVITETLLEQRCKKILSYKYILNVTSQSIDTNKLIANLNTPYAEWLNRKLNERAITLLKNENKILPLRELDKRKIAAVSIGSSANNSFHSTLKLYGNIKCFNVANAEGLTKIKSQLAAYNTIIVSVHGTKSNANTAIQNICKGKESILTFFTVPYKMSDYAISIKHADVVVSAYENTDLAMEYAAQAIFGGNSVDGKFPVSIKGVFDEGDGLQLDKVRLSYNVPEEVGINSENFRRIDNVAQEGVDYKAYPGCQVLIAKDGVIIYNKSFGSLEFNGKEKVTNEVIYDLASMTKAVATVPAIMKLYDEKKFTLNKPLSAFVPVLKGTNKSAITIRAALFHETQLPDFFMYYMGAIDKSSYTGNLFSRKTSSLYNAKFDSYMWARTDYKYKPSVISPVAKKGFVPIADNMYVASSYKDSMLVTLAEIKLRPRKGYLYSCLNFMLLKEVVENISGTDLNSFLQKNFYTKLGAETTTYNPLNTFPKSRIAPTEQDNFLRKQLVRGYVHDEGAAFMGGISGNAGLFSNANDVAKICQMLLNQGTYGGEKYMSESTCALFTKTKSPNSRRGLGFDKPETRTNKANPCSPSTPASTYGHTGFTGTSFWIDPDNNIIFIFLANRINPVRTNKKLTELGIRSRIQEAVYAAMKSEKTDVAIDGGTQNARESESEEETQSQTEQISETNETNE